MAKKTTGFFDIIDKYDASKDNPSNNQHNNNNNDQNNKERQNKGNQNNNGSEKSKTKISKYFENPNMTYNRDMLYKCLINGDLEQMVVEIKSAKKHNKKRPKYIGIAFKDIKFASALPEAMKYVFGKKSDYELELISKKDVNYILDELLNFLTHYQSYELSYNRDAIESMVKAYITIVYRYSKSKVKKFKEIDMPEEMIKKIVVLTSGKNNMSSIYQLFKYFYREVSEGSTFNYSQKNILKILKICYDDNMKDILMYIMLERVPSKDKMTPKVVDIWTTIDKLMRDELEKLDKKDIVTIINGYIDERTKQEKNGRMYRRLGDRRTIHPDDYPKLTKIFDQIEEDDFSTINYLRR